MSFILRIFFSGLIAFVPSQDGRELTVLLLNAAHDYQLSDATPLAHHAPLLLARAGSCSGQCPTNDPDVAQLLFSDQDSATALASLGQAVSGGGAWRLADSELSVRRGCSRDPALSPLVLQQNVRSTVAGHPALVPATPQEREDFSWVADLKQVCPSCGFNPALLSATPPPGLVAARLRLRNGKVFTYSVARTGTNVAPVHFQRLDGEDSSAPYTQAVATWVAADIQVTGDTVEIDEDAFGGGPSRTMSLAPNANNLVELALLNLPPIVPPAAPMTAEPAVGKHFEVYYEMAATPPAPSSRPVPRPGPANAETYPAVTWDSLHPREALWSDLLAGIRMELGRGIYDRSLCPLVQH